VGNSAGQQKSPQSIGHSLPPPHELEVEQVRSAQQYGYSDGQQ
jgi:hypothetical protein